MHGHDDHDHQVCRHDALDRVERRCETLGLRMTAQRRQVLDVLLARHVPMSAYEIIDHIADRSRRPSPISVYRALDFLVANRFVHRIESRNAFLACSHDHGEASAEAAVVFLLCESCGVAVEAEDAGLAPVLDRMAAASGFQATSAVLEMRGLCARCQLEGATRRPEPALTLGDDE
ncbi:Fur family transcriptional regulator [Mongoliimonas terrestris]|uniref:Fur family transcriptional regulator n=1 Tax=Mongoliimonas terrestris TaxID=1709001 RepID=UPI00094995AD|nr:Fur family transcriptional regulator [Mongoliimonas terrestris]